jgi:hypothetical protein
MIKKILKSTFSLIGLILSNLIMQKKEMVCFGDFNNTLSDSYDLFCVTNPYHFYITGNKKYCDNKKILMVFKGSANNSKSKNFCN